MTGRSRNASIAQMTPRVFRWISPAKMTTSAFAASTVRGPNSKCRSLRTSNFTAVSSLYVDWQWRFNVAVPIPLNAVGLLSNVRFSKTSGGRKQRLAWLRWLVQSHENLYRRSLRELYRICTCDHRFGAFRYGCGDEAGQRLSGQQGSFFDLTVDLLGDAGFQPPFRRSAVAP